MFQKIAIALVLMLVTACDPELKRRNYEFDSSAAGTVLLYVEQDSAPTSQQVTTMGEAAGRSFNWSFCKTLAGMSDCAGKRTGRIFGQTEAPVFSPAACKGALVSINALLGRETSADQLRACAR